MARAVVGDVSATLGFSQVDAGVGELRFGHDQVLPPLPPAADGDDGIVFKQEDGAGVVAGRDIGMGLALPIEGVGIGDAAQVFKGG